MKNIGERGKKLVSSKGIEKNGVAKWESLGAAEIGAFAAGNYEVYIKRAGYESNHMPVKIVFFD